MKIGIDIRNVGKQRTGDEAVFFNLSKNLAQIDSKNEYFLFTDIVDAKILEDIATRLEIQNKTSFYLVSLQTANRFFWNFWTLPKYLRQNPMDIYLTQYITPFFLPRSIKVITIIHDVSYMVYAKFIKFSDLFFLKTLIPPSLRRAEKIIAVSRFTKNEIEKFYGTASEKIAWIHNAVGDNFQMEINASELDEIRKKYNLPGKFILYMGTMQPRKNLPALVAAYAQLSTETKSQIKLVLAGGKGYNYDTRIDEIITKYNLEKDVLFPGFVLEDDKPTIFKLSHLFCSPSFYEGFGVTIIEAMTLGIPVIASDIPPHREVAENNIAYFDPNNPEELTKEINAVISDQSLYASLSQKGKIHSANFSWQKTAQKLLTIFNDLT